MHKAITSIFILVLASASLGEAPRLENETSQFNDGVRAELERMQEHDGLTIAWYDHDGPEIVNFRKRAIFQGGRPAGQSAGAGSISRDGTQIALALHYAAGQVPTLGTMHADGSNLREFSNVESFGTMGWSYDMTRLAGIALDRRTQRLSLKVVDLGSGSLSEVSPLTSLTALTSQCWSPDGKQIVFETDTHIAIQNFGESKQTTIAVGKYATWSPDGKWIAYLDEHEHSYYVIHPSGEGKKRLFHNRNLVAGLYWSPDSRIVAYVVEEGFLFIDVETYRLRVRRLQDNSDDWIANSDLGYDENLQWVANKALIAEIESAPQQK